MAVIDFPASPTTGQTFSAPGTGIVYTWNGTIWVTLAGPGGGTGDFVASTGVLQTLTTTTDTVLNFPNVQSGNAGSWWNTSNNRYTPPAGKYFIAAYMNVVIGGSQANVGIKIRKNGTGINASGSNAVLPVNGMLTAACSVDANGSDYFDVTANPSVSAVQAASCYISAFPLAGIQGPSGVLATPTGVIVDFAGSTAPGGWYICDGAAKNTTTDAALFAVIGYTYGGSGASFNLPDLGGRVTAGKETTATRLTSAGSGIVGSTLGAVGGVETYALSAAQTGSHAHTISTGGHSHVAQPGYSTLLANAGNTWGYSTQAGDPYVNGYLGYTNGWTDTVGNLGGSTDVGGTAGAVHQNTQPTMIMNKIIKA